MLRICVDTNVWISGLIASGSPATVVELALRKKFQLVSSSVILNELHRNLIQKFDFSPRLAGRIRYRIAQVADLYNPIGTVRVVPGRHTDNLILETAVLGKAKYLVTGDKQHLLPLKVFRNVHIIDPSAMLSILMKT